MRLLDDPEADAAYETSWSFTTARLDGRMVLVVRASMLIPLGPGAQQATKGSSPAHLVAPNKPLGDLLVVGQAYWNTSQPRPIHGLRVAIELDSYRKELGVFGDRTWQIGSVGLIPSQPQPFTRIPITYERAFGGPHYPYNPIGIGSGSNEGGKRVPNIVRLEHIAPRPAEHAEPAGFGPIDPSWQPRIGKLGTYDPRWLAERWPDLPVDFDPSYWNEAPADQQFSGYFRGDERLAFENMHPQHARLETTLPARRARVFATTADGEFQEIRLVLDTIAIDLDAGQTELVWRGHRPVRSPRLREINFLFASVEKLYVAIDPVVYRARFEGARRTLYPTPAERDEDAAKERAVREALEADHLAEAEERLAEADRQLEAAGTLVDFLRKMGGPELARAKREFADHDLEADLRSAIDALRRLDPKRGEDVETRLQEMDAQIGDFLAEEAAAEKWSRERVIAAHRAGEDMAETDLSGLDLSGLDLREAKLARANLSRARLAESIFHRADLSGAELGGADSLNADFTMAALADTNFTGATIQGARFTEANLDRARFAGVDCRELCLDRARGADADFSRADLGGASFIGAFLPRANFTMARIADAKFDGAVLTSAEFYEAKGGNATFHESELTNLRATAADLPRAKLTGAKAVLSVWQQAKLDGADFSRAVLTKGNLAEARLVDAVFDRARLEDANFDDAILVHAELTNANLLRASFERADLCDADFRGSNLYRAGFLDALAMRTHFNGAFLAGTRLPR